MQRRKEKAYGYVDKAYVHPDLKDNNNKTKLL